MSQLNHEAYRFGEQIAGSNGQVSVDYKKMGLKWSLNRLFTFHVALKNPWLIGYESEQDELTKLVQNCQHDAHKRTTKYLNRLLALSTLKLDKSDIYTMDDSEEEKKYTNKDSMPLKVAPLGSCNGYGAASNRVKNMLVVGLQDYNAADDDDDDLKLSPRRGKSGQSSPTDRYCLPSSPKFFLIIKLIILIYCTLVQIIGVCVIFQHDVFMSKWRPAVKKFSPGQTWPSLPNKKTLLASNSTPTLLQAPASGNTLIATGQPPPPQPPPQLAPQLPISPDGICAIRQQIVNGSLFSEQQFINIESWLMFFGNPMRSQIGSNFLSNAIIASAPIIFYCLPVCFVLLRRNQLRLDTLAFIYDPLNERCRLASRARLIIRELINLFESTRKESALLDRSPPTQATAAPTIHRPALHQSYLTQRWSTTGAHFGGSGAGAHSLGSLKLTRSSRDSHLSLLSRQRDTYLQLRTTAAATTTTANCQYVDRRMQQMRRRTWPDYVACREFLSILNDIQDNQLIRPIVINSEWHFVKLRLTNFLVKLFLLTSAGMPILSLIAYNTMEAFVRARERLQAIECTRWHPNGVILKPSLYLKPLEAGDLRKYELYDGTWTHLSQLVFSIEFKQHFATPNSAMYFLQMCVLSATMGVWSTLWTIIYLLGFLDIIAWLMQVRSQLKWCSDTCTTMILSYDEIEANDMHSSATAIGNYTSMRLRYERERSLLVSRITIAYVNYELFRRQYKPFRLLTNFLVFQAACFSGASLYGLYLIATNIDNKSKHFSVFASFCVLCFMNIYLIVASYTSKLIETIMNQLISLLAKLAQKPDLLLLPSINIWRRQLLSETEMQMFLSTRLLTFSVSYKKIVAFNVHLVGIWLILWRAFGSSDPGTAKIIS